MPGTVKVKVLAARNLPVMDRASFLTDAFVELCIGSITYKTEVVRRSLNPSWNTDWFCFKLDDQSLQEEALLLKVMDHDTYSAHDTIGRVYFDLNPLLSRGQTRCLNGWFPIYDTMHGIRGEICLAIRVDVFLDASRYHQSSLGVKFFHCCTIPQGFVIDSLIGFIQELVMNYDPEHQWIEKIRTSRASNEARQRLFSRLSGELQRKMGLKVLNLGGNSLIGYQLHFDLEGETGVVVRGIGTAVRLRKYNPVTTPPNSPIGARKNCPFRQESPTTHKEYTPECTHSIPSHIPQNLELGEFPFLTISQPLPGMVLHFGSVVASKSVRLLDKNSPAGIQFRDAWWLELRTEIVTHMRTIGCDAVLAYREECAIYEDVCILSSYGTAVQLNPKWNPSCLCSNKVTSSAGSTSVTLQKATEKILGSSPNNSAFNYQYSAIQTDVNSQQSELTASNPSLYMPSSESTPVPSPSTSNNKRPYHETTPDKFFSHRREPYNPYKLVRTDCRICHLPSASESSSVRLAFPITSSRCAVCKAANVPDLLFSSSDFPSEMLVIGNPALIQARVCRLKKDTKGEVAASELSEILPFIDYELHYRLMQKLRLRSMNGLFGLRYRLAIGEYMIAAIATGTGVYISALPPPPPPRIIPSLQSSSIPEDRCAYERLKKQVDDYLRKNRQLYGISFQDVVDQGHLSKFDEIEISDFISPDCYNAATGDNDVKDVGSQLKELRINTPSTPNNLQDPDEVKQLKHLSDTVKTPTDTVYLESREPEPEELAILLQDPIQPSGLILTTTECIPIADDNLTTTDSLMLNNSKVFVHPSMLTVTHAEGGDLRHHSQVNSFIRLHETELSIPDSFFETSAYTATIVASANSPSSVYEGNLAGVKSPTNNAMNMVTGSSTTIAAVGLSTSVTSAKSQNSGLASSSSTSVLMNSGCSTTRGISSNAQSTTNTTAGQTSTATFTTSSSSPSSSPSCSSLLLQNNFLKGGNSLGKALREFNQLTWFRFRHYMPCILNALDYRLSFTDDEHLQIIATGMILHPNRLSNGDNNNNNNNSNDGDDDDKHSMSVDCKTNQSISNGFSANHNKNNADNTTSRKCKQGISVKTCPKFYLPSPKDFKSASPTSSTASKDDLMNKAFTDRMTHKDEPISQGQERQSQQHSSNNKYIIKNQ
ncbi:unnamed protein product [Trichobilharzia szidati]|nr:unnamed protein product [Trichobilharzia szidati]